MAGKSGLLTAQDECCLFLEKEPRAIISINGLLVKVYVLVREYSLSIIISS